jgi:hypothetical protein
MHQSMDLPGRLTLDQKWYIGDDNLVGEGRSPADHDEHGLQGYHAPKILIVVDEADGISPAQWKAIFALMTNEDARLLTIGNPDDPTSEWCEQIESQQYNVIHIPIDRTPNYSGEKVPERIRKVMPSATWKQETIDRYGLGSPIVESKVFARFPKAHERSVYPPDLLKSRLTGAGPRDIGTGRGSVLSVDVAREGKDRSVGLVLGPDNIPSFAFILAQNDTTELTGEIINWCKAHPLARVIIDANGVGAGVYDNCKAEGLNVVAHYGMQSPKDKKVYLNARAERYFETQHAIRKSKLWIPNSSEFTLLRKQMTQILFQFAGKGLLKIMSKEEMAEKGIKSPDELDALTMAVYEKRLGRVALAHVGLRDSDVSVGGGYAV